MINKGIYVYIYIYIYLDCNFVPAVLVFCLLCISHGILNTFILQKIYFSECTAMIHTCVADVVAVFAYVIAWSMTYRTIKILCKILYKCKLGYNTNTPFSRPMGFRHSHAIVGLRKHLRDPQGFIAIYRLSTISFCTAFMFPFPSTNRY